jgi:hypothetical protein
MTDNNSIPNASADAFGVPGDYFASSAQQLRQRIEWEEELSAFPLLAACRTNAFAVPTEDASIDNFEECILFQQLYAYRQANLFQVPENYFDTASCALIEALTKNRTELHLPKIEQGFDVPVDYFNTAAAQLQKQIKREQKGQIISLFRKASLAAAAMLLVAIALVGYRLYHRPIAEGDCGTIACLDRKELMQHQTLEAIDNDELFEIVNPADLEKHLNGPDKKTSDSSDDLNAFIEEELDS